MINIELLKLALLVGVFFMIWLAFRIPSRYMQGYVEWVSEHHWIVRYLFGVLFVLFGIGALAVDAFQGRYPDIELAILALVIVIIAFLAWDNLNFWRREYRDQDSRTS